MTSSVLVVGTGLIGTSIGLALRDGGADVVLRDNDPDRVDDAARRGAGRRWDGDEQVALVVACVPPAATAPVLADLHARLPAATLTHVASCQSRVQRDLEASGLATDRICGGHPLAGREITGPAGATSELFLGRPWVICPLPASTPAAVAAVTALAERCGAVTRIMSPSDHDRAVALSSHLPQVAASALAARLLGADGESVSVSGPGLQDTTRIAASDPALWTDVLSANAAEVAPLVRQLAEDLGRTAAALAALVQHPDDGSSLAVLADLLGRGNAGRALVPVKRGVLDRDVDVVAVRVPDEPGRLAELFVRAADAGVNVEDVRVEHLPGRPTGVVELLVRSQESGPLAAALTAAGLEVLRAP